MQRTDGRQPEELRPVLIHPRYLSQPEGSALIKMGHTHVVCAVSVEEAVPRWIREQKRTGGWITAEYSMLPYATSPRKPRELARGRPEGRTQEIQRLIGRALRAVTDLEKLGPRTLWIDCDVLQADGGTRTAAVTGSYVALVLALRTLQEKGVLTEMPVRCAVAAVSAGCWEGVPILDLCYQEDAAATVDLNVVMTDQGDLVEVQAMGEEATFRQRDLSEMIQLAARGIRHLIAAQQEVLD